MKGGHIHNCNDCGKKIKPQDIRWLIYKSQFSKELMYRICNNCADEEWKS